MHEILLVCDQCKNSEKIRQIYPMMTCIKCNSKIHFDQTLNRKYVKSRKFKEEPPSVWKYLHNLPLKSNDIVTLNEGNTPLRISNLGAKLGLDVKIKDETRNPTGSFLDRGTTAEISILRWMNQNTPKSAMISELALSLSAYSASAESQCVIFVPKGNEGRLSQNRLHQLIAYGAKISFVSKNFTVPKNYFHFRTSNTIFMEGLKTCGFEIADQLDWHLPDNIIVPIGNGTNLYAIYRSIKELIQVGLVKKRDMPKLYGVTMLTEKNVNNNYALSIDKDTIAPELSPSVPSYLNEAVEAIHESGGTLIRVSDNDLIKAVSVLAQHDGIFASTSGSASIAGLLNQKEKKLIKKDESIICLVTGSGGLVDSIQQKKILISHGILHDAKQIQNEEIVKNSVIGLTKRKILILLDKKSDYAYNLQKRLDNNSSRIDISTLYQHLNELENSLLIAKTKAESFRGKPTRFYYTLTKRGKKIIHTKQRQS